MQISDSTTDTDEDGKPDLLEMLIGPDPYTSGVSSELTPTHHMPLIVNRKTGETQWLHTSQMPVRFGAAVGPNNPVSKLKWMFGVTCNMLSDSEVGPNGESLFDYQIANNLLPIGENLHMLGGYATTVAIDADFGRIFGQAASGNGAEPEFEQLRLAWLLTATTKLNRFGNEKLNISGDKKARVVYWPECKNDTLPGVRDPSSSTLAGQNRPQSDLKKLSFQHSDGDLPE